MFRGTSLNWMVFEEAGEFQKLKEAHYANEECYREGSVQFGTPIIGGTSNQISNDANDFIYMFNNAEEFGLKALFIPASKVYHGFFNYDTGLSDVEGATEDIEKRAEEKKNSSDKNLYYAFRQEMPLVPEHAFLAIGNTPFDIDKINNQVENILLNEDKIPMQRGRLEWTKNKNGRDVFGSKPHFVEDPDGPLLVHQHPLPDFKNCHVSAVDPYHVDDEFEEKNSRRS